MKIANLETLSIDEITEEQSAYYGITYHVDRNHITVKRHGHEFYYIDKERLLTEDRRLEWVAHMSIKKWCCSYKFYKTMLKAIKTMKLSS